MRSSAIFLIAWTGAAALLPPVGLELRRAAPWLVYYVLAPGVLGLFVGARYEAWRWYRALLVVAACLVLAQAVRVAPGLLQLAASPTELEPTGPPGMPMSKAFFLLSVALLIQLATAAAVLLLSRAIRSLTASGARRSYPS